jgi:hypothetical protein
MTDYQSTGPEQIPAAHPEPSATSRSWRLLSSKLSGWIVAAALACAVIALSIALATSSTSAASAAAQPLTGRGAPAAAGASGGASGAAGGGASGGASNARSGPAEGGTSGTVDSVSSSGFTLTTGAGQKATVKESSSTTYENGTAPSTASAVTTGADVVVVGMVDSTTITATQIIVEPAGTDGSAASAAAGVIPFQQGAPSTSKSVGQIPANYTEGDGTIVSGTTADQATEAALAAYPGGVVDRVVKLSNGEYEVHNIGTNWPHHVFVDQTFKVVGAE